MGYIPGVRVIKEYEGTSARLISKSGQRNTCIEAFKVYQTHNGNLYFYTEDNNIAPLAFENPMDIEGVLKDGCRIKTAGDIWLGPDLLKPERSGTHVNYLLTTLELHSQDNKEKPKTFKAYLTNMILPDSKGLKLKIGGMIIHIRPVNGYDNSVETIERTKDCSVTTFLEIPLEGCEVAIAVELAGNVCELLSYAKGTCINWIYYETLDEKNDLISAFHQNRITRPYGNLKILDDGDGGNLASLIEGTYDKYVSLKPCYKLNQIIQTIVEAKLGGSFLELRGLLIASAVDVLRGRWAEIHCRTSIVDDSRFKGQRKKNEGLIAKCAKKKFDATENQQRQMKEKVSELNRPSFRTILDEMLGEYGGSRLQNHPMKEFIKIRNNLVHKAYLERSDFWKLLYFADRLLLIMLGHSANINELEWVRNLGFSELIRQFEQNDGRS